MPIYEYHCPECDNLFEEWCQRIDDVKSKPCPQCGKTAERIISQTSFALKGDGWYVTEYGTMKDVKEHSSTADASTGENGSTGQDASTNGAGDSRANAGDNTNPASTPSNATGSQSSSSTASASGPAKAAPAPSAASASSASSPAP